MDWKQCVRIVAGVLLLGLLTIAARADYQLGPNDVVRLRVFEHEDMTTETRISASGELPIPLLGQVKIGGLSTAEAERKVAGLLRDGEFIRDPHVSITVLEFRSQEISVLGYVNKPGRYALDSESSLTSLIALAGGVSAQGDDRVIVKRTEEGRKVKQEVDLKGLLEDGESLAEFSPRGGDVLYVPRAPLFYIYGEVQRPGSYRLEHDMTVAQAISVGGGVTPRGSTGNVIVQRKIQGDAQESDVTLTDTLQKDDVVYVKERWF